MATGGTDPIKASSHQHLGETSPFITATDICAFKLWKAKTTWVISFVASTGYVSAWYFDDESLEIFTQDEWQKKMKNKKHNQAKMKSRENNHKKPAEKSFPVGSGFALNVNVFFSAPDWVLLEPFYG